MKRRDAISYMSFIAGGSLVASHTFMAGCTPDKSAEKAITGLLNNEQIALLDEIGDIILPTTASSPGAKAANIGEYMNIMLTDCTGKEAQDVFLGGFDLLDKLCKSEFDKDFMSLSQEEKTSIVSTLEEQNNTYRDTRSENDPRFHYYGMIKQMTMRGYFTSEIGQTQALVHVPVPGRWDPCITVGPDQKAYAI